jgi:hypothetical protein
VAESNREQIRDKAKVQRETVAVFHERPSVTTQSGC